jgi:hypothetical protein
MKAIILAVLSLVVIHATVVPRVTPIVTHVPLVYNISFEDPP